MLKPDLSTNSIEKEIQVAQIQISEQLKMFSPDQRLQILDHLTQEVKKELVIDFERGYTGDEVATSIEAVIDKKLNDEQHGKYERQPKVLKIDDLSEVASQLESRLSTAKLAIWGNKFTPKQDESLRLVDDFPSEFKLYQNVNIPAGEDSTGYGKCIAVDDLGQALVLCKTNQFYKIILMNQSALEEGNRRHFEQYAELMKITEHDLSVSNWRDYNASQPDYSDLL